MVEPYQSLHHTPSVLGGAVSGNEWGRLRRCYYQTVFSNYAQCLDSVSTLPTPGRWEQPPASNKACPVCLKSRDPIRHSGNVDHYHTTE